MHKIYLTATTILPVYNYYHYNFTNFLLLINCTAKFTKLKQSPLPRWLMTRTWIITWSALRSGSTTWGRRDGIPLRARKTLVNTASLLFNKCLYIPKSTSFFLYLYLKERQIFTPCRLRNKETQMNEFLIKKRFLPTTAITTDASWEFAMSTRNGRTSSLMVNGFMMLSKCFIQDRIISFIWKKVA